MGPTKSKNFGERSDSSNARLWKRDVDAAKSFPRVPVKTSFEPIAVINWWQNESLTRASVRKIDITRYGFKVGERFALRGLLSGAPTGPSE
jgi:hypothetical protein